MRAKTGISIASICAVFLILCAGPGLRAQPTPASAPPQPAAATQQDSSNDLFIAIGKTVLVDFAWPIARVSIGQAEVAEVHATGPSEIIVNGKAAGETSLIVWDTHGGRQFYNVTVRASSTAEVGALEALRRELRTELPGEAIKVSTDNGIIFLRGTVKDLGESARAVKIASVAGKVVNLLNVEVPASDPQIMLKVRFASLDRNKATSLGINLFDLGLGNAVGGVSTGQFSPPSIGNSAGSSGVTGTAASAALSNQGNIFAFLPGLNVGATITALQTKGLVEVLAEPNIVATNGKEASFLAGGEYPYPVANGTGGQTTISISFKEYGVRLNFIPTITPRGSIRLQVAPEVSSLDFSNAVEVSGFNVPAITSRKVNTEVELQDGQSFVIGGLLDNRETESLMKIPFLGDIPILGKLFQSMTRNRTNTELIVIVTPEIVAPIQAGAPVPELKYPKKFLPPNSGVPMNNPDAKSAANTPPPAPPVIPVEKLIESMKPEQPLVIEGATGGFGAASAGTSSTSSAPAPAPQ